MEVEPCDLWPTGRELSLKVEDLAVEGLGRLWAKVEGLGLQ